MRDIVKVIDQIMPLIPKEEFSSLLSNIKKTRASALYASPERQVGLWQELGQTLTYALGNSGDDWCMRISEIMRDGKSPPSSTGGRTETYRFEGELPPVKIDIEIQGTLCEAYTRLVELHPSIQLARINGLTLCSKICDVCNVPMTLVEDLEAEQANCKGRHVGCCKDDSNDATEGSSLPNA